MLLCCQIYRRVTACWCRDLHLTCILGRQVRLTATARSPPWEQASPTVELYRPRKRQRPPPPQRTRPGVSVLVAQL